MGVWAFWFKGFVLFFLSIQDSGKEREGGMEGKGREKGEKKDERVQTSTPYMYKYK